MRDELARAMEHVANSNKEKEINGKLEVLKQAMGSNSMNKQKALGLPMNSPFGDYQNLKVSYGKLRHKNLDEVIEDVGTGEEGKGDGQMSVLKVMEQLGIPMDRYSDVAKIINRGATDYLEDLDN